MARYDVAKHIKLDNILNKKPTEWKPGTPCVKDWIKILITWETCSEHGKPEGYWNDIIRKTEICTGTTVYNKLSKHLNDQKPYINQVHDRQKDIDRGVPESFIVKFGVSFFKRRPYVDIFIYYPRRFVEHIGLKQAHHIIRIKRLE